MDRIVIACALALGLGACGSGVAPRAAQTETLAAVRSAVGAGAAESPEAAYHLELAQNGVAHAENQIREGDMQEAELTLQRAKADAEVALALAREARAQTEAERSRARVQQIRSGGL